jgi:hypothetical protein
MKTSGDITINDQTDIADKKVHDSLSEGHSVEASKSPPAFLQCTENIDFFHKVENKKPGPEQDVDNKGCNRALPSRLESKDGQGRVVSNDIQTIEKSRNACVDRGTQTQEDMLRTTQKDMQTTPMLTLNACRHCASDVDRKPELYIEARNEHKDGSAQTDAQRDDKTLQISSRYLLVDSQKNNELKNKDILSNQQSINWYLSLLVNVLTTVE